MRSITDPLSIHQRGNLTQNFDSEDDDGGEHSKQKTKKGKVSLIGSMLLTTYLLPNLCQRVISRRVLVIDSEDEPANKKKRTNPSNNLDDGDDDSKQQSKKGKRSDETDESEEELAEAKSQVSPIW
jgi:hypothetical protein